MGTPFAAQRLPALGGSLVEKALSSAHRPPTGPARQGCGPLTSSGCRSTCSRNVQTKTSCRCTTRQGGVCRRADVSDPGILLMEEILYILYIYICTSSQSASTNPSSLPHGRAKFRNPDLALKMQRDHFREQQDASFVGRCPPVDWPRPDIQSAVRGQREQRAASRSLVVNCWVGHLQVEGKRLDEVSEKWNRCDVSVINLAIDGTIQPNSRTSYDFLEFLLLVKRQNKKTISRIMSGHDGRSMEGLNDPNSRCFSQ